MPGKIIFTPEIEARHMCKDKPNTLHLVRGTQWQCDECHQVWVLVQGSQYNEPFFAWRMMTEANKDGGDY